MTTTIALAGKGGTGKTTTAGLLIRFLLRRGIQPVLAVDADPNANLNDVLGVKVETTLGEARESMKTKVPEGMTRDLFMEYKVQQALVENNGFDLVVMGRPEGTGCYCHANTLLSKYMDKLCGNYKAVVMDNEAGMEHMSRLVSSRADVLLIISDPTKRGIDAAKRIAQLSRELNLDIKNIYVIVNRVADGQIPPSLKKNIEDAGLEVAGWVPQDEMISQFDSQGRPTVELADDAKAVTALESIFEKVILPSLANHC